MIINVIPTRGEVNDIYKNLELGAKGLVLSLRRPQLANIQMSV